MNLLDRMIASVNPQAGLRRAHARASIDVMMNYKAGSVSRRSGSVRAVEGDADTVAGARRRIALSARDVVRNSAIAERAVQVVVNNVVGTGIEPKLVSDDEGLIAEWPSIAAHLDSVAIDGDGVSTLAAIQRLAVRAMVVDGESLVVFPDTDARQNSFRVRVLEADYLDDRLQGPVLGVASENTIYDGIEYGPDGRVVAYHLFDEHPGSAVWYANWKGLKSTRVDASRVAHLYRVDRPGQRRGVSWFAPVLDDLVALADNDEAQLLRQKIAACFAAFWRTEKPPKDADIPKTLAPGLIQQIGMDDEVVFANPPEVAGYDDFARVHLRRIAGGLGITYEALTGDLGNVNFTSARLGRIEMGQNVEAWQWGLVMPRLCQPIGKMLLRSLVYDDPAPARVAALKGARIGWTPPPPVIADPKTETQVAVQQIEAGLTSRHAQIRNLGRDPSEIDAEIGADEGIRKSLSALKAPAVAAQATQKQEDNSDE